MEGVLVIFTLGELDSAGTRTDVIFRTPNMQDGSITFQKLFNQDKILVWKKEL